MQTGIGKHPAAAPKIDPTTAIIPVVTELLDFYQLRRTKGKDLVEIAAMDKLGINFVNLSRETFKDFTVGKAGKEKHISSSEKMHRMVRCATHNVEWCVVLLTTLFDVGPLPGAIKNDS